MAKCTEIAEIPCIFPADQGIPPETSSHLTASSAISRQEWRFPADLRLLQSVPLRSAGTATWYRAAANALSQTSPSHPTQWHLLFPHGAASGSLIRGRTLGDQALFDSDPAIARRRCRALSNWAEQILSQVSAMTNPITEQLHQLARTDFEEQLDRAKEFVHLLPQNPGLGRSMKSASLPIGICRLSASVGDPDLL